MTSTVAVVQFQPAFKDVATNLAFILDTIARTTADVIIFPELCTTGYLFFTRDEAHAFCEPADGPTCSAIHDASERAGRIVVFGFAERDGAHQYNSSMLCIPGQHPLVYRKTHLFAREKHCFDPGDTGFFVVHVPERDLRIGMMICYDWRFPEAARTLALKGADLIVAPSNLVTHIWRAVMPARAVENKVYLAVANRCGADVNHGEELSFNGQSAIYSFNGDVLASANATDPAVLIAEIDPVRTRTKSFNEWNDIFADRRPEHYA